jgi:hypothetical protein
MNNIFQVTIPDLILNRLDSSMNASKKKFIIRTWNSFFSFLLPLIAGSVLTYITTNDLPLRVSSLMTLDLLDCVGGAVIVNILGSLVNGAGAGIREDIRQREFTEGEGL